MAKEVRIIDGKGDYTAGTGADTSDLTFWTTATAYQAGVLKSTDLAVTERGAGADMSVDVAAGQALVLNSSWAANSVDETRFWPIVNDATFNITISANSSGNDRIDIIVAQIDTATAPNDDGTNVIDLEVVEGTPAGSPSAPATPSDALKLAEVAVANGATSITDAEITDARQWCGIQDPSVSIAHVLDINGNILKYLDGEIVEILVPTTGDIQAAIDDSDVDSSGQSNAIVTLLPGQHEPSAEIDASLPFLTLRGFDPTTASVNTGNSVIIRDTNFSGSGNSIIKHDNANGVTIRDLTIFSVQNSSVTDTLLEIDSSSATPSECRYINLVFPHQNNQTVISTTSINRSVFDRIVGGAASSPKTGDTFLDANNMDQTFVTNTWDNCATSWDLDASSDYNYLQITSNVAGTDNGTGNNTGNCIVY